MDKRLGDKVAGAKPMAFPPPPESQCAIITGVKLEQHKKLRFFGRVSYNIALPVPGVESIRVERWVQSPFIVWN